VSAVDNPGTCPNHILLARSSGPVITGATSFTFFTLTAEAARYEFVPTLGVDASALYIGAGSVQDTGLGCPATTADQSIAVVVNKASLGTPTPSATVFTNLVGGASGMFAPVGVDNDDPVAGPGYFVAVDIIAFNR